MQEENKGGFLKRVFCGGAKFVAIGVVALVPLVLQAVDVPVEPKADYDSDYGLSLSDSLLVSLAIVAVGLIIEKIYMYRKK